MGRYSDIKRGPELNQAYNKYQEWLKKDRAQKQAEYKKIAKPASDRVQVERINGWILPFNGTNSNLYLRTKIIASSQTGAGSEVAGEVQKLVAGRALDTLKVTEGITILSIPRFQFAKISGTKRTTTATESSESRISGIPYKRHRTNSASSPFGKKDVGDQYAQAVAEIRQTAAYTKFIEAKGSTVGFSPEG